MQIPHLVESGIYFKYFFKSIVSTTTETIKNKTAKKEMTI